MQDHIKPVSIVEQELKRTMNSQEQLILTAMYFGEDHTASVMTISKALSLGAGDVVKSLDLMNPRYVVRTQDDRWQLTDHVLDHIAGQIDKYSHVTRICSTSMNTCLIHENSCVFCGEQFLREWHGEDENIS